MKGVAVNDVSDAEVASPRSTRPRRCSLHLRRTEFGGLRYALAALSAVATVAGGVAVAPASSADFADHLVQAVQQARGGTTCSPLQPEPLVSKVASIAAQSTKTYLNHTARVVPVDDPLPILKERGSSAGKAVLLQGAGKTEADAVKSILITGSSAIPDCSYAQYGVSTLSNDNPNGYYLTAVVLAGP